MESIIGSIIAYKQDHPEVVITEDMIKGVIECYIEELIEEIRKEVSERQ